MTKAPIKSSLIGRAADLVRRNLTTIGVLMTIFIGIPGAVASAHFLNVVAEPWKLAWQPDVTVIIDGKKVPVVVLAQGHSTDIDYLIIKEQYRALEVAKEDLKRDPNSVSAKKEIETLNKSIDVRQKRLDKATGGR